LQDGQSASDLYNTWVLVGGDEWKTSWATVQGTVPTVSLTPGQTFGLNNTTITVPVAPDNTVAGIAEVINLSGPQGVYAAAIGGALNLFADSTATNDGSTEGTGVISVETGTGSILTNLGIPSNQYAAPALQQSPSYTVPRWSTSQTQPEPTGSVWIKTNNVNLGALIAIKRYNSTLDTFVLQSCPVYASPAAALYGIDPSGGGTNIPAGSTYANLSATPSNPTAGYEIWERYASGPTIITGSDLTPGPFVNGNTFTVRATQAGSSSASATATATIVGTTVDAFLTAFSEACGTAGISSFVSATQNAAGAIVFTHSQGGDIILDDVTGSPVATAGISTSVRGVHLNSLGDFVLSNWVTAPTFTYTASDTAPGQDPIDGTLWYYSSATQVDIMIQNDGAWMGYQMVSNDIRGYNLTLTNASGPIFSTTAPTTQNNDSLSPLQYGDLWIDTSDLENYPVLSRWQLVNGVAQWVQIDNTDQTTSNGVLFADARWAPNGTTDPITDPIPTIESLLTSDYLDLDAPNPALYADGTLLFNTRRSGYNVKSFQVDYFNAQSYPDDTLPTVTNAWVSASGNRADGAAYMGRQSQRQIIVAAMKSAMDSSIQLREEINDYNLIAAPQYPELAPNMVALNNERNNTAFCVVDTPLRLAPADIVTWATNNNGLGLPFGDGLLVGDAYAGAFYPSCQTTSLNGQVVVTAPSHMMVRTIIRSDEVAYPWLAPAGTRRGVVDNAIQIGYIAETTGEFTSLGVNQGLRDILYKNRVNPITFIPGVGITNYGNKTTTSIASALDRINVARLVAFVRGRLSSIAKNYLFEPNDQITRQSISTAITSLMIDLVAKRGIYDYLVVCDLSNNSPTTIDRNELYVDIAIEPVKAVEFIYIPVRIQNTGTIQNATVV
jgi:hypothetical protein